MSGSLIGTKDTVQNIYYTLFCLRQLRDKAQIHTVSPNCIDYFNKYLLSNFHAQNLVFYPQRMKRRETGERPSLRQ